MNPLVQEMLNTVAGQDSELVFLEGLLNDDCKCETNHKVLPCTFKVTGIATATCTGKTTLKCENGVKYSENSMLTGVTCIHCDELASDCWTIRPI